MTPKIIDHIDEILRDVKKKILKVEPTISDPEIKNTIRLLIQVLDHSKKTKKNAGLSKSVIDNITEIYSGTKAHKTQYIINLAQQYESF